jgi:ABC-2 type transport system permease protein
MNPPATSPLSLADRVQAVGPERTLRKLFLTLFLRGRGARGLRKESVPKSVGSKLALTLAFYAAFGLVALMFRRQPVFALAVYLHAMTLMFLGMFVASSAGEVLFNKEEADILMHRPVMPRALLWAKIGVLVQVSLWLAGAFNLVGLFVGVGAADGGWLFPVAHALSTILEALFSTSCVVLVYQLCLRWFGRERLDALMTTAQVVMAVAVVVASQAVPQLIGRVDGIVTVRLDAWWVWLLPPAWFGGLDDALAGSRAAGSWVLAAVGMLATAVALWLAFEKLANDYETGLQALNETTGTRPRRRAGRRWIHWLVHAPPLRWWLKDSVTRASFLLTAAYLVRDRDVKLRVYPGLAPMMVMPFIFMLRERGHDGASFGVAFAGSFLGLIPVLGLSFLQYSQQWHAAEIFRAAPIAGPAPLSHGARLAVLCLLTFPVLALYGLILSLVGIKGSQLALLLPGLVALPVYALVPCLGGKAVPLSLPTEEAKSAGRGLHMIGVMIVSMALSGLSVWAWSGDWFRWLLIGETILVGGIYALMRVSLASVRWTSLE